MKKKELIKNIQEHLSEEDRTKPYACMLVNMCQVFGANKTLIAQSYIRAYRKTLFEQSMRNARNPSERELYYFDMEYERPWDWQEALYYELSSSGSDNNEFLSQECLPYLKELYFKKMKLNTVLIIKPDDVIKIQLEEWTATVEEKKEYFKSKNVG